MTKPSLATQNGLIRAKSHQVTTSSATAALYDPGARHSSHSAQTIAESEDIMQRRAEWLTKFATEEGREEFQQRLAEEGFVLS